MLRDSITWEHRDRDPDVLFVTNMWPDAERPVYGIFIKRQIDSLRRNGLRCDVLYVRGYLGPLVYLWAWLYFAVASLRWRKRYDLVHLHAGETALVGRGLFSVPVVASYCGDDVLGKLDQNGNIALSHRIRRFMVQQQARLFDATITKSREMNDALPGAVREKNNILPNGVDIDRFRAIPREEARAELGWPLDERVVLFAATHPRDPRKRLWLAEEAIALAEREVGPIRLFVAENQAPERVPVLMNAADCLLHTSYLEGSPNVIKEAALSNLPVVCTPSGDVHEVLDGVVPSAVADAEPAALAAELVNVLRSGRRSNGRKQRADLSEPKIAGRLLGIYASCGFDRRRR